MHLSEAARIMDDIEYLKALREADREWVIDFRTRYGLDSIRPEPEFAASDLYEAHSHHAEYAPASH